MRRLTFGLIAASCAAAPLQLVAQARTELVTPGPQYEASPFVRFLLGNNWRDIWIRRVRVPVLDLGTFAGGLTAFQEGGNQSRTLRLRGKDGKVYIFRSTDKFVHRALPDDLSHTPIGDLIQDQSSSMHPTGHLVVAALQSNFPLLQATPQLVIMPNDPRLGEFQETFGGMLGQIEERPDEAEESGKVSFDAKDIESSEKLFEELEQTLDHEMISRDYLTARLIDFLIGDTDRGADQWRWARYERPGGDEEYWRPIPRDRDYAFMAAEGVLAGLTRTVFDKLVAFKDKMPPLRALTFMTQEFDRSHLVELPWATWDSLVTHMQASLNDAAITEAVSKLPPEHYEESGGRLVAGLRARRDALRSVAFDYFTMINREADVFASFENDLAEITRNPDGTVDVNLFSEKAASASTDGNRDASFSRRFLPSETQEIRVHMQIGNDRVTVRGQALQSIKVRVTGGAGDDVLIDSSTVARGGRMTVFYDSHGQNTIVPGPNTRVDQKTFVTPQPLLEYEPEEPPEPEKLDVYEERRGRFQDLLGTGEGFFEDKTAASAAQNWGAKTSLLPAVDYREGAGPIIGVSRSTTRFGFRHTPYESLMSVRALFGIGNAGFGLQAYADFRPENAPWALTILAQGSQFESNRFYGFGNNTPDINRDLSLVMRDELLFQPALRLFFGETDWISVGPIARYVNIKPEGGSPAADTFSSAFDKFGQLGGQVLLRIDQRDNPAYPRSGFTATGATAFYPAMWDVPDAFTTADLEATAYLPIGRPTLAFRVGGMRVWGDFPLHEAAFIGGRHTVRGFRFNRYTGDSELHGTTELRVPIVRTTLLTRGTLGAFVFGDAGRVWMDGASPGDWHTGIGGGLSFYTLGVSFSAAYAHGAQDRFYVQYGLPF